MVETTYALPKPRTELGARNESFASDRVERTGLVVFRT